MRLQQQLSVIAAALAATTSLAYGQAQQSADSSSKPPIVGTWQVLRHGVDCVSGQRLNPDFPSLITFNRGGTLNGYAIGPGDSPATTSPEYGNWTHQQGTQSYIVRDVGYGYDDTGTFAGRGEVTATITLAADGNTFTADTIIDIFDADGNLLFSFCGAWAGTRFE
jgi:hypothetical protein